MDSETFDELCIRLPALADQLRHHVGGVQSVHRQRCGVTSGPPVDSVPFGRVRTDAPIWDANVVKGLLQGLEQRLERKLGEVRAEMLAALASSIDDGAHLAAEIDRLGERLTEIESWAAEAEAGWSEMIEQLPDPDYALAVYLPDDVRSCHGCGQVEGPGVDLRGDADLVDLCRECYQALECPQGCLGDCCRDRETHVCESCSAEIRIEGEPEEYGWHQVEDPAGSTYLACPPCLRALREYTEAEQAVES